MTGNVPGLGAVMGKSSLRGVTASAGLATMIVGLTLAARWYLRRALPAVAPDPVSEPEPI